MGEDDNDKINTGFCGFIDDYQVKRGSEIHEYK
jgi:hypothetical protein